MNLADVEEPRLLKSELVSANFFAALGVEPMLGRTFRPDEDQEKSASVMVISHRLWLELGGSPAIAGRQVSVNGAATTIVGVMPATFAFPAPETDAWAPLALSARNRENREARWLTVIGRLTPNASRHEAAAEMDVIASRLAAAYPAVDGGWSTALTPLQDQLTGKTRPVLLTLQAAALLLLLIACVNLANLLLARGASRAREFALRAALGAGRGRILRQMIVESSLIAALGGVLGLAIAARGIVLVRVFADGLVPRASEIHLSAAVALFALGVTMGTALVFGLAPALTASRFDLRAQIASGARTAPRSLERRRGVLVAIEVAVASILLVGAALLGESLTRLLATSPGLRTDHAAALRLTLARSQYPTNAAQNAFFHELLDRVVDLPGVSAAAEVSETPLAGNNPTLEMVVDGLAPRPSDPPVQAGLRAISPAYFTVAGIPLLRGRNFTFADREATLPVAIVNETMARRYWPGASPIGRRVRFKDDARWMLVAGVAADTKHMGLQAAEGPVFYIPYAQKTQDWLSWTTLLVRTPADPAAIVPSIRAVIRGIDRNQPIADAARLDDLLARSTAIPRFTTVVFASASGLAFLIAVIGVYGLLAYTFARRMPELGIRLTLGASPAQVSWLLLRHAMTRVLAGIASGLLAAWWLVTLLDTQLFAVSPRDPATFALVAGVLLVAALIATVVPARRALTIDPLLALRAD